ncbi:hypothetical protein ACLTEW_00050 [Gordonia lacunae]|uniref:hypothetical protein n=1 Tax=Gordonia lacunae TaxID=417102 RepID=UPI0039E54320
MTRPDPPRSPPGHRLTHGRRFPSKEPAPELKTLAMGTDQAFARYAAASSASVTGPASHRQ